MLIRDRVTAVMQCSFVDCNHTGCLGDLVMYFPTMTRSFSTFICLILNLLASILDLNILIAVQILYFHVITRVSALFWSDV